jgi:hypothetical protein
MMMMIMMMMMMIIIIIIMDQYKEYTEVFFFQKTNRHSNITVVLNSVAASKLTEFARSSLCKEALSLGDGSASLLSTTWV